MKPQNPNFRENVRRIFETAPFLSSLGLALTDLGPGWCESALQVARKHLQQDGYIHAGVQAAVADHTAGGAAGTLVRDDETVLTLEFKINLLRPAQGDRLRCRSAVLRAGKTIIVAESEVFAVRDGAEKLASKATVTLAVVGKRAQGSGGRPSAARGGPE
jgi:uncharacterized protein (TIGR00369 family)